MASKIVVGRALKDPAGLVLAPFENLPHPETCWCRPPEVALAALQRTHPLPQPR